ncbi:hypothetical protein R1flu_022200 [Riccia fluitans]|uniref:Ribosomal protein S1 n=1 Tax=Riccia fluitans TaxID=41844 RepID=A0ABD1ZS72_9MARC
MATLRANERTAHGLLDLQIEPVIRPIGIFVDIHVSQGGENDENLPMFRTPNMQDRIALLRPSPRRPLEDITHLFPFNLPRPDDTTLDSLTGRIRTLSFESPVASKKRKISDAKPRIWDQLSRPAMKCARPSNGLRSFR